MKRILIILASGIGNSIMFGPTLKAIREKYEDSEIDIFAYKKSFAEPFTSNKIVDNVFYYSGFKTLLGLRKRKYDICVTAFPSNKWQFNLFAFLVGAKQRVTHSYTLGKLKTLSFLQNCKIPADSKIHDVDQNINLLRALDIEIPMKRELFFCISEKDRKFADEFIIKNKLRNKTIVGVHPGSGPLTFKRAPKEEFLKRVNKIKAKNKVVFLFGGPEELESKKNLAKDLKCKYFLIENSLKETAALTEKCKFFITNDSGMMHIAVSMKVPKIIVFFNGTNPSRTRPYTKDAEVVMLKENIMKYPFFSTNASEGA